MGNGKAPPSRHHQIGIPDHCEHAALNKTEEAPGYLLAVLGVTVKSLESHSGGNTSPLETHHPGCSRPDSGASRQQSAR